MSKILWPVFLMILVLQAGGAWTQTLTDPATAALLDGGAPPQADDLDSSRFNVRPADPAPRKAKSSHPDVPQTKIQETPAPASAPPAPVPAPVPTPVPTPLPTPVAAASNSLPPKPSIAEQVKVLILGNDEEIEDFRKQTHPEDRRNNYLDLSLAPGYFYNSSSSNYSFRRFTSQGPDITLDTDIWISPFFALHADYFTSLDAAVASGGPKQSVTADYQNTEFGVRFRNLLGVSRKAASLTWGLDYFVDEMLVPSDTPDRVSTMTSGLALSLQADMPQSLNYSHLLGIEFRPRLVHSENSSTSIHSGNSVDTNAVGAWFGGEWVFDRHNQIFWNLRETVEQNSFQGPATVVDPTTGTTPNGVSVTNSMTVFSLGYRWGN